MIAIILSIYIYMAIYGYIYVMAILPWKSPYKFSLTDPGRNLFTKKQKIQTGSLTWAENGNARDDDDDDDDDVPWYMKETLNP